MRKKHQKAVVYTIVGALIVSLIVTMVPFMGGFTGSSNNNSYEGYIKSLEETLAQNPEDKDTRLNLANLYYDWGMQTYFNGSKEEANNHFEKAIANYEEVLKEGQDVNVLVDMATAAFYSEKNELAEEKFQEALEIQPDFLNGLYNYGVFLMYAKEDFGGAIAQWEKALENENLSEEVKANLQQNIQIAQQMILENFEETGNLQGTDSPADPE
ncbi:MAG: tetratricopeptide repeat protein [Desulfitobacterium sp.]|nr:tetratricopeptide repeat protein [Desulfitobacterium sp.]